MFENFREMIDSLYCDKDCDKYSIYNCGSKEEQFNRYMEMVKEESQYLQLLVYVKGLEFVLGYKDGRYYLGIILENDWLVEDFYFDTDISKEKAQEFIDIWETNYPKAIAIYQQMEREWAERIAKGSI